VFEHLGERSQAFVPAHLPPRECRSSSRRSSALEGQMHQAVIAAAPTRFAALDMLPKVPFCASGADVSIF
jgi:hypothetical protein